jgi:lipopolysaccharide export LptBFGC system permease protein LptF
VVLIEFDGSQAKQVITARTARWVGEWLDLDDVQTSRRAGNGSLIVELDRARHRVGLPPTDLQHRPETMTIPQMRSRIAELRAKSAPVAQYIRPLEQAIAVRRATPWCALGFALVSAPLGIRRVRASTGVSFGLAILVFLPYYFVSYTLQVLNKHGGIHPEIPAWTANILLLVVATGLIIDRSR